MWSQILAPPFQNLFRPHSAVEALVNITRHTCSAQLTTPSSVRPQTPIRMLLWWARDHHRLGTLKVLHQVCMAVLFSVVLCLTDLQRAWSSVDNHPWASPCRAAWSSTSRHLLDTRRGVLSWKGTRLHRRSVRGAPVWTSSPCTAGTPLQKTDTQTYQDKAAPLDTRVHPLHPSQSPQVTRMGGSQVLVLGSNRVAPPSASSLSFQRGDVCLLVIDHMEECLTTH